MIDNPLLGDKTQKSAMIEKKGISALIFTKDNPKRVIDLVKKIQRYVDEIVIIDSSSPENFRFLSKNITKKIRLYNLPPLGIVEPFQKIGAKLCKNDWILHLDDDEVPSDELLRNLDKKDAHIAGLLLSRLEKSRGIIHKGVRYYNRKKIYFTGIIHWGIIPIKKIKPMKGLLYHYENPSIKKFRKYALLDSYVWGYKILWIINNGKWHPLENRWKFLVKIYKGLAKMQFLLGKKLGWFLCSTEYLLFSLLYAVMIERKYKKIFYYIFVFRYIVKDFGIKIRIWEDLFSKGDLNSYLGLENVEDFKKLGNKKKKGLDLLISLIEEKVIR